MPYEQHERFQVQVAVTFDYFLHNDVPTVRVVRLRAYLDQRLILEAVENVLGLYRGFEEFWLSE